MITLTQEQHYDLSKKYTIRSKAKNMFSTYPKKIVLFKGAKSKRLEDKAYLPSRRYILRFKWEVLPYSQRVIDLEYNWTLNTEQLAIMDIIKRRWEQYEYGCWLIVLKTARWKSHIIMSIAKYFWVKTLVLCHNIKTTSEMMAKFKEFCNYTCGISKGTKHIVKDITICTHTSFMLHPEKYIGFDLILHDECDVHCSEKMFQALCTVGSKYHYWLTGTPYRNDLDNADLQFIFGKQIQIEWQENGWYNFIPKIHIIKYRDKTPYQYDTFAALKTALLMNDDRLNDQITIIKQLYEKRKCILILTERVEESERYAERLQQEGFCVGLFNGTTNEKCDNDWIAKNIWIRSKNIIIWTSWKMARWIDIPAIDTIFFWASLHFQWTVVQAVWRALRYYKWKEDVMLIDWSDFTTIQKQYYERMKSYVKEYNIPKSSIHVYDTKVSNINEMNLFWEWKKVSRMVHQGDTR